MQTMREEYSVQLAFRVSSLVIIIDAITDIKMGGESLQFFIQWHWIFMNRQDYQFKNDSPQGLPTQWTRWCMSNLSCNPPYL